VLLPWTDLRISFLSGHGCEPKSTCGAWKWKGCLDYAEHQKHELFDGQKTFDGVAATRVGSVKAIKMSCGRLACPVCYEKACARKAVKIEHRMLQFKIKGRDLKAFHLAVSPPRDLDIPMSKMRKLAEEIAMSCGVIGGSIIVHHLRKVKEDDFKEDLDEGFSWRDDISPWYFSPHFHIICFGWIKHVAENYSKSGWVVRNLGVRKSIRSTALYQLSHCYVRAGMHSVAWFGALSYNKLNHLKPCPPESHPCPICKAEMKPVVFIDPMMKAIVQSNLEKEEVFIVDEGLFRYSDAPRRFEGG